MHPQALLIIPPEGQARTTCCRRGQTRHPVRERVGRRLAKEPMHYQPTDSA